MGNADIAPDPELVVRQAVPGEKMHATEVVCVVIVAEPVGLKPEVPKPNALHATEPENASRAKAPENVRTVTVLGNKYSSKLDASRLFVAIFALYKLFSKPLE